MTKTILAAACLAAVCWAGVAWAEPPGETRRFEAGANLGVWMPQDDADDNADESLGIRARMVYWITPMIGVGGSVDYVFVNEDPDGDDVDFYGIGVSGVITTPRPARIKPFGELELKRYTLDPPTLDSESDFGFHLGGGARMALSPGMVLVGEASYSTVELDFGFVNFEASAFILEVGIAALF